MPPGLQEPSPRLGFVAIGAAVLCCAAPLLPGLGASLLPLLPAGALALAAVAAGLVLWRRRRCRQRAGDGATHATADLAYPE